jgi:hypothetical protein
VESLWADTDAETRRVHLELLRRSSPGRRLRLALSLSASVLGLSRRGLARAHPGAGSAQLAIRWVRLSYGEELARELEAFLLDQAS